MPQWIHQRAEHLLAKNPSMPKSEAFAVATQQSHALGKSPKGYGTAAGRHTAKEKFDTPKDDVKTSNPGHLESPKMKKNAFATTLLKLALGGPPPLPAAALAQHAAKKVPNLFDISKGPAAGAREIMGGSLAPKGTAPKLPASSPIHGPVGSFAAGGQMVGRSGGLVHPDAFMKGAAAVTWAAFLDEMQNIASA